MTKLLISYPILISFTTMHHRVLRNPFFVFSQFQNFGDFWDLGPKKLKKKPKLKNFTRFHKASIGTIEGPVV